MGQVGVSIQAFNAPEFVQQVQQAEAAGIDTAWSTIGGAAGADPLTVMAAAATATTSIRMGTAIIPTWPRHPLALASQALAVHQLAPGRLRLGIGPSHEPSMVQSYGVTWRKPLLHLREYLESLRTLFQTGAVDYEGEHVTARGRWREPADIELVASALRPRSFEVCGELADGAISWMCPRQYLVEEALPALRRGAEQAGRPAPPLIAHVPVMVSTDRAAVRDLARKQIGFYGNVPFYRAMFERAGFTVSEEGYPDALLDDLVVSGTPEEVAAGLRRYLDEGCGEVLAAPLVDPADRLGSIGRAFEAVAAVR
ncbi:MAG: LLM class flavin-dependent oxidoreductase [Dehalococcoidia bacterium]|nr:LLM class flavin-dependent oxidoreductase [Dehalococcoidia bacterium]